MIKWLTGDSKIAQSFGVVLCALILSGCAPSKSSFETDLQSRNGYLADRQFKSIAKNNRIRFLIFHYTALDDNKSLQALTGDKVSAHYLVPEQPRLLDKKPIVYQLVEESQRAWHAGVSKWHQRVNLNDSSIGIEIVNPGFTEDFFGSQTWYPFKSEQIKAVTALAKDIIRRYQITPDNVLGHSDITPLRKQDPGRLFPWQFLAEQGIGAWPNPKLVEQYLHGRNWDQPSDVKTLQHLLKRYGYDEIPQDGQLDEATRLTINAFQSHFRQRLVTGMPDAETEAIAQALITQYRS